MIAALLPCPFCGHEHPEFERMGDRRQSCIVICGNCGARHESGDEGSRNGSSWNQRSEPGQDGLRATLETALARIEDMLADDDGQAFKEARKFLESARQLAEQGAPANSVKIPTGEDEAALMLLLSMDWLKRHAPHRFKHPEQGAPQADALYFDAAMPPVVAKWLSDHPPTNMVPLTAATTAPSTEQSSVVEPVRSMPAEPVAYSVTCNGKHVKNVFAYEEQANEKMLNLNMHYPQDKRAVVPLFATPHTEAVRMSEAEIPDVDWLANVIRLADGNNTMGAGELAETIVLTMQARAARLGVKL